MVARARRTVHLPGSGSEPSLRSGVRTHRRTEAHSVLPAPLSAPGSPRHTVDGTASAVGGGRDASLNRIAYLRVHDAAPADRIEWHARRIERSTRSPCDAPPPPRCKATRAWIGLGV